PDLRTRPAGQLLHTATVTTAGGSGRSHRWAEPAHRQVEPDPPLGPAGPTAGRTATGTPPGVVPPVCRPGGVPSQPVRSRQCSRSACNNGAVATLTYVYADSTAVLGPLAGLAEPHSYDLCARHAERLTAPRGWEVLRLAPEFVDVGPTPDDLVALAEAVREAGRPPAEPVVPADLPVGEARRAHLRVLSGEGGYSGGRRW